MHAVRSIALVGLSGAGKSTVARLLAAHTTLPLIDTDVLLAKSAGRSIGEIFAADGEAGFRNLEAQALAQVLPAAPAIIATGGGIVLLPANRARLRDHAFVVWLDAPTAALVARLLAHDEARPLLNGNDPAVRLEALRTARAPLYAEVANLHIDTNARTADEIAHEILAAAWNSP